MNINIRNKMAFTQASSHNQVLLTARSDWEASISASKQLKQATIDVIGYI
jgi:hypothetical protein